MGLGIARLAVDLVGRRRPGNGEAPGIGAVGNLFQFVEPFLADREVFRIGFVGIEGLAIDLGHRGDVMDALHAPFDLQAGKACVVEVRQIRQEAEVLGVEDIRSPFIFDDGEILAWPLFFDDVVLEAAALDTFTAVRVAVALGEIIAQQAAAGIGNAHGAMNKGLNLQIVRNIRPQFLQFFHGKFPCGNHTFCTLTIPEPIGLIIGIIGLCADMAFNLRTNFLRNLKYTRIRNNQGIRFDFL